MKKLAIFVCLLFVSVFALFAAETNNGVKSSVSFLPDYYDEMLFVNKMRVTAITTGGGFAPSVSQGEFWQPLKGHKEISKIEFFELTSQDDLLSEYRNWEHRKKVHDAFKWVDVGLLSVSGIMTVVSAIMFIRSNAGRFPGEPSNGEGWKKALIASGVITGVSVIALPIIIFTSPKEPNVSINFAISLAEGYNNAHGYVL